MPRRWSAWLGYGLWAAWCRHGSALNSACLRLGLFTRHPTRVDDDRPAERLGAWPLRAYGAHWSFASVARARAHHGCTASRGGLLRAPTSQPGSPFNACSTPPSRLTHMTSVNLP